MLALVLAAGQLKRVFRRRPKPTPPPPPQVTVHPSLDRGEGDIAGDEIDFAGPEVHLGARLEPGATIFEGGDPAVEREER